MKLGLHTYSLNLHGIGQAWAGNTLRLRRRLSTLDLMDLVVDLDLEGIHLDDGVLETLDTGFLTEIGREARLRDLYLEYNFSMDLGGLGIGIQHDLFEALETAQALGADIVKVSMDLKRPKPVTASRFHPDIVRQMQAFAALLKKAAPRAVNAGIRIAVENHCDSFSEEILWLLDQVDHPAVGACIDTVNALHVGEDPMQAIRNLAPRAFTNHFRDDAIVFERWGYRLVGTPVGQGDIDMRGAYEIFTATSTMNRINIETELPTPLDDLETAMAMEIDAIRESVRFCRENLGIRRDHTGNEAALAG